MLTSNKGISLIESSFALLLFAIAILPIMGVLTSSMNSSHNIESSRYAQEQGFNIMTAILDRVPFECLWASEGKWLPGSIRAQSIPSTVQGVTYDSAYAKNLVASVFPGSTEACTAILETNNIKYQVILEVTDIVDPTPDSFSGTSWNDPSTWQEMYFDYYKLPDFHKQPQWDQAVNVNNDSIIGPSYRTPYRYYDEGSSGNLWGPAERNKNGSTQFKKTFPRDIKDRTNKWSDWDNCYCQMKKLRLRIKWNLASSLLKEPLEEGSRSTEIVFVAFKANIQVNRNLSL